MRKVRGRLQQCSCSCLGFSTVLKDTSAACRVVTPSSDSLITKHPAASENPVKVNKKTETQAAVTLNSAAVKKKTTTVYT